MLLVSKSSRVQCLSNSSVARRIYTIMIMNEMSSNVTVPLTEQGPCSDSARPGPTPEAVSKLRGFSSANPSEK